MSARARTGLFLITGLLDSSGKIQEYRRRLEAAFFNPLVLGRLEILEVILLL